ncbi:flavin monoamine oxidase family protein [Primorskyibacter sp. S187A]|uniref:flavin monoamine oxidase family protein n=1 Tax=Primorskyibacter sp. S187A TaxID=3415130 RepID=UPI003C7C993C
MRTETLILGAGLSGLSLAVDLSERGRACHVLEARDRIGGRILTTGAGDGAFDMGPAWFWGGQPRLAARLERLNLRQFEQYASGALSFEDEHGHVERVGGMSSMEGALRIEGGAARLTEALAARLPAGALTLSAHVTSIARHAHGIRAETSSGLVVEAEQVVLAMPPRLAAEISYTPALPDETDHSMRAVPTWMAGQAKVVAVYPRAFWRVAGLSGDAMSRRGPMVEIHDASAHDESYAALFGFVGLPPQSRGAIDTLEELCIAQLVSLFGAQAAHPTAVYAKDWAADPFTATPQDRQPLFAHPRYGLPETMENLWDNRLVFAGTEVAPVFGGYLEGALEAAEAALAVLERDRAA